MKMRLVALGLALACAASVRAGDAIWPWSVPVGEGRAFLWIPENCTRVRAVVLAQHNMIERHILEHPTMRRTLTELGMAEVFVVPSVDNVFRFDQGASERFDRILQALADESGYGELATAPIAPMGHSAHASFPWNFAAANPARTLAVLSVKGDAPLTDLTGSGRPNPDWGARQIDGIPGLMVMSEGEWWEARLTPLLKFRAAHSAAPLAVLCDTGHGHFDASDELVEFLALFLRKTVEARLGSESVPSGSAPRSIDPRDGWLADRWRRDKAPHAVASPWADFSGDRTEAFWCFDEEMARATDAYHARGRGRRAQQVDFVQSGELAPISTTHAGVELKIVPEVDGATFHLSGDFIQPLPPRAPLAAKDKAPPPTTIHPRRAADGEHAVGAVSLSVISGPVEQLAPDTFRIAFDRMFSAADHRASEAWLLASHPGDAIFKGAVQQALLRLPRHAEGAEQTIAFLPLADQPVGTSTVALHATASSGLPVSYYVREGPAFVRDGTLQLTPLPPRAKLPVTITIVAWQPGRGTEPKIRAAKPVEQSFRLVASAAGSADRILPGEPWLDDRGLHVQAHGGGILKLGDTYYWFGEDRSKDNDPGRRYVACYSSQDLTHWRFRNQVLKLADPENFGAGWVLERPKVFYNPATKQFVMYMHIDGRLPGSASGYSIARVGVAVCDTVDGDYRYVRSFRPLGKESRDIGQFVDDDGSAYLIFESRPSKGFYIAQLSDDYLDVAREVAFIESPLEGGAVVRYDGLYYAIGSALTGWRANPNKYATAKSLVGPWSEFKDIAPPETNTYGSQSTMMLKVAGTKATTVIFMADIWKPSTQWESRYLWMPLEIGGGKLRLPAPRPWSIDVHSGETHVALDAPASRNAPPSAAQ